MGSPQYDTYTQVLRWFFVICNAFFLVCGIIEFAIGTWVVVAYVGDNDVITGNSNLSSGAILLVSGMIVFVLSLVGFLGGIFMSRALLIIYAIGLGFIIVLQLAGAILAFVFSGEVGDRVKDGMEEALKQYRVFKNDTGYDEEVNDAVDSVQRSFKCCGIDNSSDWVNLNREAVEQNNNAPPGDCDCDPDDSEDCVEFFLDGQRTGNYVWSRGCLTLLEDQLKAIAIIIGVISLIIALVEIAFLALAIGLTCLARKNTVG